MNRFYFLLSLTTQYKKQYKIKFRYRILAFLIFLLFVGSNISAQTYVVPPYSTGFESGTLGSEWTTNTTHADGRVTINSNNTPHSGNNHLSMQGSRYWPQNYSYNSASLHLDLSAATGDVFLTFWMEDLSAQDVARDGIYFSDDGGANFTKVMDYDGDLYTDNTYYFFNLNITALAASNGLNLTNRFVVRFQQYGYEPMPSDGISVDDIAISVDSDGDGIIDAVDLDDDNDGIADKNECGGSGGATTAQIGIFIDLDEYENETSWDLVDPSGTTVASGGTYADGDNIINQTYTATTSGTYVFTIHDSYGDGLSMNGGSDENGASSYAITLDGASVYTSPASPNFGANNSVNIVVNVVSSDCDTDGDGIVNRLDLDSDNDGIYDIVEAGNGGRDTNHNGRTNGNVGANGLDNTLENNDSSTATINYTIPESADDTDTILNFLDLDSDGDGIPDNIEAQATISYVAPGGNDTDHNGVDDNYDTNGTWLNPPNTDGVDNPDYLDTDSDNEAGNDTVEAGFALSGNDSDGDGLDNNYDTTPNAGYADPGGTVDDPKIGIVILPDFDLDVYTGGDADYRDSTDSRVDTDGDGILDMIDLDDDNDGIPDAVENASCIDPNSFHESFGRGIRTISAYTNYCYEPGDGNNAACSAYPGNINVNDGEYAILQFAAPHGPNGASSFSTWLRVGDHTGNTNGRMAVFNADDRIAGLSFYDRSNITVRPYKYQELNFWVLNLIKSTVNIIKPNLKITIQDDAGVILAVFSTSDIPNDENWHKFSYIFNPGAADKIRITLVNNALGGQGNDLAIDDISVEVLCDTDNDGLVNSLDLDSDDDGIYDIIEVGNAALDANHDGMVDNPVGNNGLDNTLENNDGVSATTSYDIPNTDGTGNDDYMDIDSDDDGIPDVVEAGGTDEDNDGHVDYPVSGNPISMNDADHDGLSDEYDPTENGQMIPYFDSDGDGLVNVIDIDSDADGIVDNIEGQTTDGYLSPDANDDDEDGLDNSYDQDDQRTQGIGGGTGKAIVPTNTDFRDLPDYLDLNSDNDSEVDAIEGWDWNNDGVADITPNTSDADHDGLNDAYDHDNTQINPTNGQVPTDFPNLDVINTDERDWREVVGFPNIITPNNDGQDDEFYIEPLLNYPNFKMQIFDRWGSLVYNYENKGRGNPKWWDGTSNVSMAFQKNGKVPEGVYFYVIDFNDGDKKPRTGFVQIIRN